MFKYLTIFATSVGTFYYGINDIYHYHMLLEGFEILSVDIIATISILSYLLSSNDSKVQVCCNSKSFPKKTKFEHPLISRIHALKEELPDKVPLLNKIESTYLPELINSFNKISDNKDIKDDFEKSIKIIENKILELEKEKDLKNKEDFKQISSISNIIVSSN